MPDRCSGYLPAGSVRKMSSWKTIAAETRVTMLTAAELKSRMREMTIVCSRIERWNWVRGIATIAEAPTSLPKSFLPARDLMSVKITPIISQQGRCILCTPMLRPRATIANGKGASRFDF